MRLSIRKDWNERSQVEEVCWKVEGPVRRDRPPNTGNNASREDSRIWESDSCDLTVNKKSDFAEGPIAKGGSRGEVA